MYKKFTKKILKTVESWMGIKLDPMQKYRIVMRSRPRTHRKIRYIEEKKTARSHFAKRLSQISEAHDIPYNMLRISSAKTRWGSCSRKRNINLNWKLIFAPPEILDYVIMHELSHLIYMNHSKAFWAHVAKMMPEYKTHRTWLKKNGRVLSRTTSPLTRETRILITH